jgi:uncharacterized protein
MTIPRIPLLAFALLLAACGGGGGGGGGGPDVTPPPSGQPSPSPGPSDDDARREVLSDLATRLILPTLRAVDTDVSTLADSVAAWANAPADATARSAAQAAWRDAMDPVQRAEVLQIGPAARSTEPGGMDLRDQLYAYPLINLCGIHNAAYADTPITTLSPINTTGLGALEYLLFANGNTDCPAPDGVNGPAKRAEHAARIATRAAEVATELRNEWETSGDDFVTQYATAGAGSTVFDTPQMALNALSTAIFYAEKETKDRKIANPTGFGATGLPECPTASCPERVESRFAEASGAHLAANLETFRALFTGVDGGRGLNDLLDGIGREDLATKIVGQIDAALTAAEALASPGAFEEAVADVISANACINAASTRQGEPEACALLGLVDAATDTLRAEVTAALNLTIPQAAAGDND